MRRRVAIAVGILWLGFAAGCAPLPPLEGQAPPPAASTPPRSTTPVPAPVAVAAPIDSTPSPAALEVLGSIPEPLRAEDRIAAPEHATPAPADTPAVTADSTAADTGGADVPTPEPTLPLGERRHAVTDSTAAPAEPPQQASPAPQQTPPPAAHPTQDTGECWRVQILAPLKQAEAEQARSTASSLLLVPLVIEHEGVRYKVRTKDCQTRAAAELLRKRAIDSGFAMAFCVNGRPH